MGRGVQFVALAATIILASVGRVLADDSVPVSSLSDRAAGIGFRTADQSRHHQHGGAGGDERQQGQGTQSELDVHLYFRQW